MPTNDENFSTTEELAIGVVTAVVAEKVEEKRLSEGEKGIKFESSILERGVVGGGISYGLGLVREWMVSKKIVDIVGNKHKIGKTSKGKNKLALEGFLGTILRKLMIP